MHAPLHRTHALDASDDLELDPEDGDEGARADPKAFAVLALARSYKWVIALAAVGATVGLVLAAAKPNTYTSQAKLLLRLGAREEITAEDIAVPGVDRRESRPTMQDEMHMLRDATIYEGVAAKFGAQAILEPADPSRDDGPDTPFLVRGMHELQSFFLSLTSDPELVNGVGGRAGVKLAGEVLEANTLLLNEHDSNVITVIHTATSPERAQAVTDALTAAFIERHRSQFSIQSFLGKNREKLIEARKSYETARKRYYEHVDQCGFIDLEVQGEALMNAIDEVERDLFSARVRRDEITAERKALAVQLENTQPVVETLTPPVMGPNPEYDAELGIKRTLMAERDQLVFEAPSVAVREQRQKQYDQMLAKVELSLASLQRTIETVPEQRSVEPNPEYVALKRRMDDLDVDDQGLLTRTRKLDLHLKAQEGRLDQLAQCTNLHGLMEVSIEAEKETYTRFSERYSSLEALSSIDIEGDTNLRVMQAARLPFEKDGPNRKKIILMGVAGGVFAGALVALLRQMLDRTLRYPSAIERELGVPVLAVVPQWPSRPRAGQPTALQHADESSSARDDAREPLRKRA